MSLRVLSMNVSLNSTCQVYNFRQYSIKQGECAGGFVIEPVICWKRSRLHLYWKLQLDKLERLLTLNFQSENRYVCFSHTMCIF
jgi:hypothetical protein